MRRLSLITLLLPLLAAALQARAARVERRPVVDQDKGFALRLVEDMKEIPTPPGEEYIKAKFTGDEWTADWTRYTCTLEVVFVPRADAPADTPAEDEAATTGDGTGETDGEEPQVPTSVEEIRELMGPNITDAWSWAEATYREIRKVGEEQTTKVTLHVPVPGKKRTKKERIPARFHNFAVPAFQGGAGYQGVAFMVATDEGEWGLFYMYAAGKFGDYYKAFVSSCRTLELFAPQGEEIDREDNEYDPVKFRAERKADLPPGWKAIDTEHYIILHHVDTKLAGKIAKRLERCHELYEQRFPPRSNKTAVAVVRVCEDAAEYHQYGGPGGSAGYWSRWDKELVFYESDMGSGSTFEVLQHEAFHQYIYYFYEKMAPHIWYNEGHADYFGGFDFKGRRPEAEVSKSRRGTIRNALTQGELVPLEEFIHYTQGQYYANAGLCYAQGWAFIYFLRESRRLRPEWRTLLDDYLENIWAETNRRRAEKEEAGEEDEEDGEVDPTALANPFMSQFMEDAEILQAALEETFKDTDLDALEQAFHTFIDNNFKDK